MISFKQIFWNNIFLFHVDVDTEGYLIASSIPGSGEMLETNLLGQVGITAPKLKRFDAISEEDDEEVGANKPMLT